MDLARSFSVTWFGNLGGPQTMYVINIIGAVEPQPSGLTKMEIKKSSPDDNKMKHNMIEAK